MDFLRQTLDDLDADFYLCGPSSFIQTMSDGLRFWGVADSQIAYEYFTPVLTDVILKKPRIKLRKKSEILLSPNLSDQFESDPFMGRFLQKYLGTTRSK